MTTAPMDSVPFSELLRRPAETTERLSRMRAVRLHRRDSADLVLMSADRAEAEGEVVDLTARLLASVVRRDPQVVHEVLPSVLPWMRFLPATDAAAMVSEFLSTVEAAASLGSTTAVSQMLTEWRHTAEIHADPELHAALTTRLLGDFGAAPKPGITA